MRVPMNRKVSSSLDLGVLEVSSGSGVNAAIDLEIGMKLVSEKYVCFRGGEPQPK